MRRCAERLRTAPAVRRERETDVDAFAGAHLCGLKPAIRLPLPGRARKTARRERPAAAADHSSVPAISI
ncbi:putative queuine/archaeosine tRNA-ribosyltransferase [Burkholderia pseudomallei NCTC 13179]|nr:putative queuine/archaeosine tRNA-ribosyltransferase [Burkholderia pseudomallei NCTC 13179]